MRFPTFNAPNVDGQSSPKPMEIDEGDISAVCGELTIESPKYPIETPSTVLPSNPSTPALVGESIFLNIPEKPIVDRSSSSVLTRIIRSIVEVDEDSMRRIAMFPYVLSGYFQLLFNITLPAFFLYWLYSFGSSISSDVETKVQLFSEEVMEQIAKCSRDYRENRCNPSTRVPALISACQAWEECMNRDPHLVAKRSGISAEIFGETINSFFNVLSWKSIASLVMLVVGVVVVFNFTFSMSRKEGNRRASDLMMDSMESRHSSRRGARPQLIQLGTNSNNTPRVRRRY